MKAKTNWVALSALLVSLALFAPGCGKKKSTAKAQKTPATSVAKKNAARPEARTPAARAPAAKTPAARTAAPQKMDLCQTFCTQMHKCLNEVAAAEAKQDHKPVAQVKAQDEKEFGDVAKCAAGCRKSADANFKKHAKTCLAKTDCKAFAECLMHE